MRPAAGRFVAAARLAVVVLLLPWARPAAAADEAKLDPFITALDQLQQKYYDESLVGSARLLAKAEDGVVDSLDPESLVIDGSTAAAGPADPGLVIGVKDGAAWILDVLDGSPAAAAGLRAGDRLMRVDGDPAYGKKRVEVEHALSGAAGTRVVLLWENADGDLAEAVVERQVAARPAWRRIRLGDSEFIQVFRLDAAAAGAIREALSALRPEAPAPRSGEAAEAPGAAESGAAGATLDLRRCATGDLDAALELADAFMPGGQVLAIGQGAAAASRTYLSTKKAKPLELQTVLLVGPGTAGPAELFAGALHDQHRAVVVGRRTFGFVGRQKDFKLASDGNRRLRLTVERFYTPGLVSLTVTGVGADLAADPPGPHDTLRLLERHRIVSLVVDRLLKTPPAVFDAAGIAAGELRLTTAIAKGKSVAEQRGELEQAFEIVLNAVLNELFLDVPREELDLARLALISRTRVELARRVMSPEAALAVALREDPEVALGIDTLKAVRKLVPPPRSAPAARGKS